MVFDFKETMPIVQSFDNQYLKEHHWDEIKNLINQPDLELEKKEFTLGQLISYGVADKQEEIVHISVTATQENSLEQQIKEIQEKWNATEFMTI